MEKKIIITEEWASGSDVECIIEDGKNAGNGGSFFSLKIVGGQVENCNFSMYGEWEREDFLKLLKKIVKEMESL